MMSNYLATVTLGDCVGPEFLASLDIVPDNADYLGEFLSQEQAEWTMNTAMSQSDIWDRLWRFGIIVDDDMSYYIPDDNLSDLPLVQRETIEVELQALLGELS